MNNHYFIQKLLELNISLFNEEIYKEALNFILKNKKLEDIKIEDVIKVSFILKDKNLYENESNIILLLDKLNFLESKFNNLFSPFSENFTPENQTLIYEYYFALKIFIDFNIKDINNISKEDIIDMTHLMKLKQFHYNKENIIEMITNVQHLHSLNFYFNEELEPHEKIKNYTFDYSFQSYYDKLMKIKENKNLSSITSEDILHYEFDHTAKQKSQQLSNNDSTIIPLKRIVSISLKFLSNFLKNINSTYNSLSISNSLDPLTKK